MIRITPIRLVGPDNEQLGVVETSEALRMADQAGMDLVEISPEARPPVCRIMDYGKFKYEQSKEDRQKKNKTTELKEVRLGRSIKIDPHDVGIRVDQARRFLLEGHKVLIVQVFRGREMMHQNLGVQRLQEVIASLADISKVEVPPRTMGKRTSLILAPDRVKIEAIKRKKPQAAGEAKPRASDEAEGKPEKPAKPAKVAPPAQDPADTITTPRA